jgi:hypothetical protein
VGIGRADSLASTMRREVRVALRAEHARAARR